MTSSTHRNLIFISYYYPPSTQMAARRAEQLAGYLVQRGWSVHVITIGTDDESDTDNHNLKVTRLRDPLARVTVRAQATGESQSRTNLTWKSLAVKLGRAIIPFDSSLLWNLRAALYARRLLRSEPTSSTLLTSTPPFATTLAGFLVKLRHPGLRWVHELRDLVATNPCWSWGKVRRCTNFLFERALLKRVDGLVFLTEAIEQEYRVRYAVQAPKVVAYNGFDESFVGGVLSHTSEVAGRLRLLHVGSFYGARTPHSFLGGIRRALDRMPAAAENLSVTFVGQLGQTTAEVEAVKKRIDALGLSELIHLVPPVAHAQLQNLYSESDVLVLITHADGTTTYAIPGKLSEYIGVGRKILAVTDDPLPKKIIEENNLGWVCPHDEFAIEQTLVKLLQEPVQQLKLDTATVTRFAFSHQAAKIATMLNNPQETGQD